jgi:hypothetical protein
MAGSELENIPCFHAVNYPIQALKYHFREQGKGGVRVYPIKAKKRTTEGGFARYRILSPYMWVYFDLFFNRLQGMCFFEKYLLTNQR